ncbi:hypothetical protein [Cohaesibacter celericrescens]|uniref:Curlin associated repeat-containing protein n=1 Tax=Cohaesibacter celericrescens TaxID=2067669 RepID=A0A2N5XSV8_9HYPH|nr:hypothetical protein [Cohaesibacter celericrescens]PLW77545.1 hypothetical protein C0081_09530 [Cohaesibacter celericrescens]
MHKKTSFFVITLAAPLLALAAGVANAGDENILILKQEGAGNEITVDQHNATDSQVGGVAFNEANSLDQSSFNILDFDTNKAEALAHPLLQIGNYNSASVTLTGRAGAVFLQQGGQITDGNNQAQIDINSGSAGGSLAAVLQDGSNNSATVTINGSLSQGNVLQQGDGNQGTVEVGTTNGLVDNVKASLTQTGDNNDTSLSVIGISAGEYSYTVVGNNTTTSVPAVIVTNGASVSITQSQF